VAFKGGFATLEGQRCDPRTVRDRASRDGLRAPVLPDQKFHRAQQAVRALFRRRGQPAAWRRDHGGPFGATGPAGRARLSAWWIRLGIEGQFLRPGHPEDNGSHEQGPRELQADTTRPAAATPALPAARTTRWRRYDNEERPP
jgi:transposase InsO family protein